MKVNNLYMLFLLVFSLNTNAQSVKSIEMYIDSFNLIRRDSIFYDYKRQYCKNEIECNTPLEKLEYFFILSVINYKHTQTLNKGYVNLEMEKQMRYFFSSFNNEIDLDSNKLVKLFGNTFNVATKGNIVIYTDKSDLSELWWKYAEGISAMNFSFDRKTGAYKGFY